MTQLRCQQWASPLRRNKPFASATLSLLTALPAHTNPMTAYSSFEDLETSVPLAQLRPSVAFAACSAHLPHDVDSLHGDDLIRSLSAALSIHSKARVVLQCWVLLIMRRQAHTRCDKDALYDRLQDTAVVPQERTRYRRGAMLLCHLLVERDETEADSLLDSYVVKHYFPWSCAVNSQDDMFYLQSDVVHWVRQALDYFEQNGSKITASRWKELSCPAPPTAHPSFASSVAPLQQQPLDSLDALFSASADIEQPFRLTTRTRGRDVVQTLPAATSVPPLPSTAESPLCVRMVSRKRRRMGASSEHGELESLKHEVQLWARQLRRQLLRAVRTDDKRQIHLVADKLQAPPLARKANKRAVARCNRNAEQHSSDDVEEDCAAGEDGDEGVSGVHRRSTSRDSTSTSNTSDDRDECAVCAEEPPRLEQVWSASCRHGSCGECMFKRLSGRARKCMHCRAKLTRVVDESGNVYQHYEWVRWWKTHSTVGQHHM